MGPQKVWMFLFFYEPKKRRLNCDFLNMFRFRCCTNHHRATARSVECRSSHYEVLGLSQRATEDEIKAAFRKHAKKWHPDVNKEVRAIVCVFTMGMSCDNFPV